MKMLCRSLLLAALSSVMVLGPALVASPDVAVAQTKKQEEGGQSTKKKCSCPACQGGNSTPKCVRCKARCGN